MSRYPLLSGVGTRSPLYQRLVVPYLDFVRHHRGRRTTHQIENILGRFCAWLDGHGPDGLKQLTPSLLRDFISSLAGFRRSTVATHASALRGFLAYLRLEGVLDRDLVSVFEVPRVYSMAQPPRILEDDTVERLLTAVDRSTPLGKRDLAMLLLAARYGLRSADIRGLRFDHVHWREQRIVLVQSKTQRPLELPLLAEVDSALVNYIRKGRPACPAREIFVRHVAPIGPLGPAQQSLAGDVPGPDGSAGGHRDGRTRTSPVAALRGDEPAPARRSVRDHLGHPGACLRRYHAQVRPGRSGRPVLRCPPRRRGVPMSTLGFQIGRFPGPQANRRSCLWSGGGLPEGSWAAWRATRRRSFPRRWYASTSRVGLRPAGQTASRSCASWRGSLLSTSPGPSSHHRAFSASGAVGQWSASSREGSPPIPRSLRPVVGMSALTPSGLCIAWP